MIILKIGGGASINHAGIITDLANLNETCIIVHGANAVRDALLAKLGQEKKVITSLSGYDSVYSDEDLLDSIKMAYAGLQNKNIVALCQQQGINAIGLSGIDGGVVKGMRNKGIKTMQGDKKIILRDLSGKPKQVNKHLLQLLLDNGYTPVLCIPLLDEDNIPINSENDDIVSLLQETFQAETVIHFIEAPGLLEDRKNEQSIISTLSPATLAEKETQVQGRMKRKLLALQKLFTSGAQKVIIADGRTPQPLQDALNGKGTIIQ